MSPSPTQFVPSVAELLARLATLAELPGSLPDITTPLGRMTHDFLRANWAGARDGLLRRTRRLRVTPRGLPTPLVFGFEIDLPFKRRLEEGAPLELAPGPLRGTIRYRSDVFRASPDEPTVVVFLDRRQGLVHPNYSGRHGILCGGGLPPGPVPLDFLLEHLYSILSYENVSLLDPADREAAEEFRSDATAWQGLEAPRPLYGPGSEDADAEEDLARDGGSGHLANDAEAVP